MKHDFSSVENIYIICGRTDMRNGIDGLATLVQDSYNLDPYSDSIFLFCGTQKDRYKCLYFDGDGFAMLYKRLDNGRLQWPRNEKEVKQLTQQELRWLLEGLSLVQSRSIKKARRSLF
ncbi:transposase [Ureibacillus acetophenoni]|uniref:Transposase n=1 Tax=Ureibacillus acetophenoni TaxID=614649 RepID=A0A285UTB2_9BACL|nr:transposase [Ureibacillus acetophenoni]